MYWSPVNVISIKWMSERQDRNVGYWAQIDEIVEWVQNDSLDDQHTNGPLEEGENQVHEYGDGKFCYLKQLCLWSNGF